MSAPNGANYGSWDLEELEDPEIVEKMSISNEFDEEFSPVGNRDDSIRSGVSNIPFSSSSFTTEAEPSLTVEDDDDDDKTNESLKGSLHVRKNSKRLNITSKSTSFDPKRRKCQTPTRFFFEKGMVVEELEARTITRHRRTSSVDSLNAQFPLETTPPPQSRSRKSSRVGCTPRSVASRCSLNDPNINSKFIFTSLPEDSNLEANKFQAQLNQSASLQSKSADTGLAGFFSITLDFDHKKNGAEDESSFTNPRKLVPVDVSQVEDKDSSLEPINFHSNHPDSEKTNTYHRVGEAPHERLTPVLPFRKLSLN